jgi:hypothetical protein
VTEASEQVDERVDDKVRLGGMALANGVLVHGPTSWACAVRTNDGAVKVVAERKRVIGSTVDRPLLRGPARLLESFAFLPRLKRALPEAKLPFEGAGVLASTVGSIVVLHAVRRVSATRRRSSSAGSSRLRRQSCRCAKARSPPITAPSTLRSGATSTASGAQRSTSAAALTSSALCSSPRPRGTLLPPGRPSASGPPRG